jgi:hypothetical protein
LPHGAGKGDLLANDGRKQSSGMRQQGVVYAAPPSLVTPQSEPLCPTFLPPTALTCFADAHTS